MKNTIAIALALILTLSSTVLASAAETGEIAFEANDQVYVATTSNSMTSDQIYIVSKSYEMSVEATEELPYEPVYTLDYDPVIKVYTASTSYDPSLNELEPTGPDRAEVTRTVLTEAGSKLVTAWSYTGYAEEVVLAVNAERAVAGKAPLQLDTTLSVAALQRAVETTVLFSHTRPNGTQWYTVCTGANGENIAMGYTHPADVMDGWMNSQGHRENILDGDFTRIGVGCVQVGGQYYWVQLFGM